MDSFGRLFFPHPHFVARPCALPHPSFIVRHFLLSFPPPQTALLYLLTIDCGMLTKVLDTDNGSALELGSVKLNRVKFVVAVGNSQVSVRSADGDTQLDHDGSEMWRVVESGEKERVRKKETLVGAVG